MRAVEGGWDGEASAPGVALVGDGFSPDWELLADGTAVGPRESFGWGLSFDAPTGGLRIRYTAQSVRTAEMVVLAILWLAALWVTRKPVSRYEPVIPGAEP
jgi:hypothetical protein